MHAAVIQLTKEIYEEFLKKKGYRLVSNTLRYAFEGGSVISRLRGCSKYNRDAAPRWRFQVDSRILFDELEYDPQKWPLCWMFGDGPMGKYAGGLYSIENKSATMAKHIAKDICLLTDRLLAEQDVTRSEFERRIKKSKQKKSM